MAELVDYRIADLALGLLTGMRHTKNRATEDGDLVRHAGRHVVRHVRHRDPPEDSQQLGTWIREQVKVVCRRLILHDDDDVLEEIREAWWQLAEGILDELLKVA